MHPLLFILGLIFLLLLVWIYNGYFTYVIDSAYSADEGFQTQELDPAFLKSYQQFISFYNTFLPNWEKAAMTSMSMNAPPPEELTDPSQAKPASIQSGQSPLQDPSQSSNNKAPTPSREKLNAYIKQLSKTSTTEFPPITDALPKEIDRPSFESVKDILPTDIQPYLNALTWMNKNIAESQANLKAMKSEGFDNPAICPAVIQCIDAQKAQAEQDFLKKQQLLTAVLEKFNTSTALKQLMKDNEILVKKTKDIQNQAQSGELLNSMAKSNEPKIVYTLPPGANALADLESSDPATYQEYKTNYAPLFGMKQQFEQINRNLR